MNIQSIDSSESGGLIPDADAARQAIASLRGYAYQTVAASLAWLDLDSRSRIFLEVAEDYAVVAGNAIKAVQVKDTKQSGKSTLNTDSVIEAIGNFVRLVELNSNADVRLHYFTTADIGIEKTRLEKSIDVPGIVYWRRAAVGADIYPLRKYLESEKHQDHVIDFVFARSDDELRRDLLKKIHWECGNPDFSSLLSEFQERFIVVGRDTFNLPAQDAARIADKIIYHVLQKSVEPIASNRSLTRAEFLRVVDGASRVSVSLTTLQALSQISLSKILGASDVSLPLTFSNPSWLASGSDFPLLRNLLSRPGVEKSAKEKLQKYGVCFLIGASGVGKSSIARNIASQLSADYSIVDFRNNEDTESKSRLETMLPRLGGLATQVIVLEDLNSFNDSSLQGVISKLFESCGRRDILVIVTSYSNPTAKALTAINQGLDVIFNCPYFLEEECASLVKLHGGDSSKWGLLAYMSGAFGHPQLVHAFVVGMALRGWPDSEIDAVYNQGLSTGDIDAERENSRKLLVSLLPNDTRTLLYRLSLVIGSFNRSIALNIAALYPPIPLPGEALDGLIGPWIETLGLDNYRVSPLAAKSGSNIFSTKDQEVIHNGLAFQLISNQSVDIGDVDKILFHAMLGKNSRVLISLANSLITGDQKLISHLADNMTLLRVFDFVKPIYPENMYVSSMLRLLQFTIITESRSKENISKCADALLADANRQQSLEFRDMFSLLALGKILNVVGIANYLDNWIQLLLEFEDVSKADNFSEDLMLGLEADGAIGGSVIGALFAIGSSNLFNAEKLENIFIRLDRVSPQQRSRLLSAFGDNVTDSSVLVNGPWVNGQRDDSVKFDARDTAARYQRMAALTAFWGYRKITIHCWIARSVMFDEYLENSEYALAVLEKAVAELGEDVLLSRARAKIYWRAQDHQKALAILRGIAHLVGEDSNVERFFALREAAISAANCDEWEQAREWFLESKISALQAKLPKLDIAAIGLDADVAIAEFKCQRLDECLKLFATVLISLSKVEPSSSLQAAHCHHLVRHSILWVQSQCKGGNYEIDGQPITFRPGMCSNPEPSKEITDRPIGSIDIVWYTLAELDLSSRKDCGIANNIYSYIDGLIPAMEVSFRSAQLIRAIEDRDPTKFSAKLIGYVESISYLADNKEKIRATNIFNPSRDEIPTIDPKNIYPAYSHIADDAILTFAMCCACKKIPNVLPALQKCFDEKFGVGLIGEAILSHVSEKAKSELSEFDAALIDLIKLVSDRHPTPLQVCEAGLRFFFRARASNFHTLLIKEIAEWQRIEWTRIVISERFQIYQPFLTVPALKTSLSNHSNDVKFLSTLLLAAVASVRVKLPQETIDLLLEISSS